MNDQVRVTGSGQARATADLARFTVTVAATRPSLEEAAHAATEVTSRVRETLGEAGISGADAQTGDVSLGPEWRRENEPQAYAARQRITVTAGDLSRVGTLIAALAAAGGDDIEVGALSFEVRHPRQLETGARDAAWADARTRAEHYAHLAGRRLGAVREIVEGASHDVGPRAMRASMADAEPLEIEPGDVEVTATVTVAWELA